MSSGEVEVKRIFCAIVGAGMCGVTLADRLLSNSTLKQDEFVIFDRNTDFGGVWESNKYPGAACDIPSHAYVVRSFLNPGWTKKFSDGKEIQQYYAKFAARRKLAKNTLFQTTVHEARWNEETLLWEIKIENQVTGMKTKWIANVLFDNGGGFHRPKYAAIPGRETFKGEQLHTGQWRTDIDLTGKRVAIIGTGPSAAQVGPKIQPIVEKLHIYQRSCGHVLPRNNHVIPTWKKLLFSCFYPVLWLYHVSWVALVSAALPYKTGLLEPSLTCLKFDRDRQMWMSGADKNHAMHEASIQFLEREVEDPIIREKLRPTTEFGCKRVLFLDDWYSMFNQPNVELVTEKPIRITKRGIVSKTPHTLSAKDLVGQPVGAYEQKSEEPDVEEVEREIDVLIWGTGFDMNDSGGHFQIYGKGGINLSQTWRDYPETYRSVAVTNFPNLFLTLGPNSTNYWSNLTTVVEIQANYHCQVIKHIKKNCKTSTYVLYPDPRAQKQYNDWLRDNRGTPSFLASHCATYHKTPAGATPMYNHYRIWDYNRAMDSLLLKDFIQISHPKLIDN